MRIEMIDRKLPATSIFSTPGNVEQNKKKYGKVRLDEDEEEVIPLQDMETETETDQSQHQDQNIEYKDMSNSTFVNILAVTVWLLISGLNLYMLKNLDK